MIDIKAKLTEGSVGKTLFYLTLPMIIGMVGMLSFNLIDTYFIGQLGTNELAAISFTFPITYIVTAISLGIGTGASAVVSQAIGKGDHNLVVRYASDGLALSVFIVGIFLVIGMLTITPLFTALGAGPETMPYIYDYMKIWYPGIIFVVIPMVGNSIIRATGDTKTPSFVMMVAVIFNLILDPLLIFGWGPIPRLEISGAAYATAISRALTLILSIWILYKREKIISFKIPLLKDAINSWKKILYIGLPSAGTSLIIPIGASVIISIVSAYGPEAVAGFGVASRIEALSLTVIMALGSVLGPFVGQNLGAEKMDRVKEGIKKSVYFGLVWGAFMFIVLNLISEEIAILFNEDPKVIEVIVQYMWIVPVSYGLQSVIMLSVVSLNVMNKPLWGAFTGVMRMLILYIPLAYLGSEFFGLPGIFSAAAVSNLFAAVLALILIRKLVRKYRIEFNEQ